jgi:phosphoglycerate dehydrogenase-like enzyme
LIQSKKPRIAVSAETICRQPWLRQMLESELPNCELVYRDVEKPCTEDSMVALLQNCSALVVGKEPISAPLLRRVPGLKLVAKYGVGLDNVDMEACRSSNVVFSYAAGVNADSVAEHTIGLMLALVRNIGRSSRELAQGKWLKEGGRDLRSLTVGIVGFGNIGSRVGKLVRSLGSKVIASDILDKAADLAALGAAQVDLSTLLKTSDVVTLHVPLTAATRHMLNRSTFNAMKTGSFVVNTARGAVIATEDLKSALTQGPLAGAALDVFEIEPVIDKELYSLDNLLSTPHIAAGSREARAAMAAGVIDALRKFTVAFR